MSPAEAAIYEATHGKRSAPHGHRDPASPTGVRANGRCGICDAPVPPTNGNLFYCGDFCRALAWDYYVEKRQTGDPRIDQPEHDPWCVGDEPDGICNCGAVGVGGNDGR